MYVARSRSKHLLGSRCLPLRQGPGEVPCQLPVHHEEPLRWIHTHMPPVQSRRSWLLNTEMLCTEAKKTLMPLNSKNSSIVLGISSVMAWSNSSLTRSQHVILGVQVRLPKANKIGIACFAPENPCARAPDMFLRFHPRFPLFPPMVLDSIDDGCRWRRGGERRDRSSNRLTWPAVPCNPSHTHALTPSSCKYHVQNTAWHRMDDWEAAGRNDDVAQHGLLGTTSQQHQLTNALQVCN